MPYVSTQIPARSGGKRPTNARPRPADPSRSDAGRPRGKQAAFQAQKRRQQRLYAGVGILAVVAIAAVLIGVKVSGGGSSTATGSGIDARRPISASSLAAVENLTVDQMRAAAGNIKLVSYPIAVTDTLTAANGQPELLYIGAEYCPYCAGERWAMVAALSKFGTFTGLHSIVSSPSDTASAAIPTFSFYQATYSSPSVTFRPVETQTVSGTTLEKPTAAESANESKYDGPPYVKSGGIPYLNLGGKWIQDGINFDNSTMQHQSFDTVAQQIGAQSTQTAGQIAATAGVIVSRLCQLTGGQALDPATCKAFPSPVNTPA